MILRIWLTVRMWWDVTVTAPLDSVWDRLDENAADAITPTRKDGNA